MPTSLLTQPPAAAAETVEDVLAIAWAMEREAATRYAALARAMERVGRPEMAAVFDFLAGEERRHAEGVERLSQSLLHRLPAGERAPPLPEAFSAEDVEGGTSASLTPYRALSIAVVHEERAFAFWTYIAAAATSEAVRAQAEAMARQELVHAARLRQARRRAFHAERAGAGITDDEAPPAGAAAARREAARLEGQAAAFLGAAAARLDRLGDPDSAALLRRIAGAMEPVATDRADPAARSAEAFAAGGPAALLFEAAGVVERLSYRYLHWLEERPDPAVSDEIQARAQAALAHLASLNERLFALEPALAPPASTATSP